MFTPAKIHHPSLDFLLLRPHIFICCFRHLLSTIPQSSKMATPCDVPAGVITGDDVVKLLKHAKDNGYAIPAFNCTRCVTEERYLFISWNK